MFPSLKEGKNCNIFLELRLPPQIPQLYLGQTKLFRQHLALLKFFPLCNIFSIIVNLDFFFTSGIGPDILTKVFEYYIILLIWAAWVLFNFYLKQKQRFSVSNFTENTPSSPFIKEFCQ